jgi:enamine deaminase RidA (YjgF/YER057c/UK114 family)
MTRRQNISSGASWEAVVGYSRAVRIGAHVAVAGTTAVDADGAVVGPGDPAAQTRFILAKMLRALAEAGGRPEDVIRTRMYVTDIAQWEAIGRAHGDVFGHVRPATAMVEVSRLIDPALLVEIELDAVLGDAEAG